MKMTGNTVLVTGGGSGIGRGLAEALHARGNRVIVAGRRRAALDEVAGNLPGMHTALLDVGKPDEIKEFAAWIVATYPDLNVLINNAGIMEHEEVSSGEAAIAIAERTIVTNLLGPIRLSSALLPHLRRQPRAAIINVSSGLAFVPMAATPTYSATKAAIHSYTTSLRYQLRNTSIEVIELAPPLVATDLTPGQRNNPRAMPLDEFIDEAVTLLAADPAPEEVLVDRVKPQRTAEAAGRFDAVFAMINPSPAPAQAGQ